MIDFECDYTEGAHPQVLERLCATNMEQTVGYGEDAYSDHARQLIREACHAPESAVHFLVGGTQTNRTVISAILRPHQGVIGVESAHIAVHESGAIEASGHKVLTLPGRDGKLTAEAVLACWNRHMSDPVREHCVQPGMVYISFPTEVGTLYSLSELEALSVVCRKCRLPLFVDGARLGYALAADGNDVSLPDLARLCDVFYIGGTKVGALFGEAVVITNPSIDRDFRYIIKQNEALLAKGRLLGLQFEALMQDGLYVRIARNAIDCAMLIRRALEKAGLRMVFDSRTNQQFVELPDSIIAALSDKYRFSFQAKPSSGTTIIRICTSWGTRPEHAQALADDLTSALAAAHS